LTITPDKTATATLPLKARKRAHLRLTLKDAAVAQLEQGPIESLSIKGLCAAAMISEATFFNHFPRKTDLLVYLGQLWSLELLWHARQAAAAKPGLAAIGLLFDRIGQSIIARPGAMGEVIAHLARLRERPQDQPLSRAERQLAFPALDGIADLPEQGLDAWLVSQLEIAIRAGEIPANAPLNMLLVALRSIFFGVPVALRLANPRAITAAYRQQLSLLFAGLHSAAARGGSQQTGSRPPGEPSAGDPLP
jgi:AcrR family transcriptional regulator